MVIATDVQYLDIKIENRSICSTLTDECLFYVKDDTGGSGNYQLIMLRESDNWATPYLIDSDATGIQITNVDSHKNDSYVWYYKSGEVVLRCAQIDESNTVTNKVTTISWMRFTTSKALNDGRFIIFRWYDDYAGVTVADQSVLIYEFYGNYVENIEQPQTPTAYSSDKGSAWQTPVIINSRYYFCINAFTSAATGYQWGVYSFLTGKINQNGTLVLSWEKFEYFGELTKAEKQFKKIMRFHLMEHQGLAYLWVGVVVENYGGSNIDYLDYYMVRSSSTGLWYVQEEATSGFFPVRPYETHNCSLYQRGVFGLISYWVDASTNRTAAVLSKNEYQRWDSQTLITDTSHVSTGIQRYISNYTPMTYYKYNTVSTKYDIHYEAISLMDDPPAPVGLREGVVWGAYGFTLWSQFSWQLDAVYWELQILKASMKKRLLGVTNGASTILSVSSVAGYVMGDTITIEGAQKLVGGVVSAFDDLNGFVGDITGIGAATITVALNSAAFATYAGGGYIDVVMVDKTIGDGVNPVQTYYNVLESDNLVIGTAYEWRCRCVDTKGDTGDWSDAGNDNRPIFTCYNQPEIATPTVTENLDSQFPYISFTTGEYRIPVTSITTVIKTDPGLVTVHTQTQTGSSARLQPQQYRAIVDESSSLATATNYKATVTITNKSGYSNSATSAQFHLTFAPLADPTGLTASDKHGYIKLSWTQPGAIAKYIILRDGTLIDTISDSTATPVYYDTSCENDRMYTYTVKSFDDKVASTGVTVSETSRVFPWYAIVEKTTRVKPLCERFATDPNNLSFASSNNAESVGSTSIATYTTLGGTLSYPTAQYLDFVDKID
ncbi:MAG: hypothetical protein KAH01_02430, partial [Caldisericia bacterium]|nr:hypothetical protein [Caldisericia bacterium]